jgi:hypothetical protein
MNAEVQKAIYAALNAAAIASVTEIRDTPITKPTGANFPFIELGATQAIPADAGGDTGIEEYIDIHVYSRAGGQRQVKDIMGAVYTVLHHQALTVTGRATAFCFLEDSRTLTEADGLTRHGVMTFRIDHRA